MGVLLAVICGFCATTSALVESGGGSASRATLRIGRTRGIEFSRGLEISCCSTSRRGTEVRVACALEDGAAGAKNRLRVRVVTRNTTTIVTPTWTIVRFGEVSANCGLRVGWTAVATLTSSDRVPSGGVCANECARPPPVSANWRPCRGNRETIWLFAAPLVASRLANARWNASLCDGKRGGAADRATAG